MESRHGHKKALPALKQGQIVATVVAIAQLSDWRLLNKNRIEEERNLFRMTIERRDRRGQEKGEEEVCTEGKEKGDNKPAEKEKRNVIIRSQRRKREW